MSDADPAGEPVAADEPAEREIRLQVLEMLATSTSERVLRVELRAALPTGRTIAPGDARRARGAKARGNLTTERLRKIILDLEKQGLVRREPEYVVILDQPMIARKRAQLQAAMAREASAADDVQDGVG